MLHVQGQRSDPAIGRTTAAKPIRPGLLHTDIQAETVTTRELRDADPSAATEHADNMPFHTHLQRTMNLSELSQERGRERLL